MLYNTMKPLALVFTGYASNLEDESESNDDAAMTDYPTDDTDSKDELQVSAACMPSSVSELRPKNPSFQVPDPPP